MVVVVLDPGQSKCSRVGSRLFEKRGHVISSTKLNLHFVPFNHSCPLFPSSQDHQKLAFFELKRSPIAFEHSSLRWVSSRSGSMGLSSRLLLRTASCKATLVSLSGCSTSLGLASRPGILPEYGLFSTNISIHPCKWSIGKPKHYFYACQQAGSIMQTAQW